MSNLSESRPAVISPEGEEILYLAVTAITAVAEAMPISKPRTAIYQALLAISSVMRDCDRLPEDGPVAPEVSA